MVVTGSEWSMYVEGEERKDCVMNFGEVREREGRFVV